MTRLRRTSASLALSAAALALLAALPACSPPPPPAAASSAALPAVSPLPADLAAALDTFRAEGPKGWAFTQTTSGDGKERVERYDPRQRGSARWTLISDKGAAPTEAEQQRYRDTRPPLDSSANLAAQLDRDSALLAAHEGRTSTYEFRLKPGSGEDKVAPHMRAHVTLDHPTGAIVRVELFTTGSFKPATSLVIDEARTTLVYSLPTETLPALPQEVTMHVRGKRFWLRSFEEKVTSAYSDHENVAKPAAVDSAPAAP